MAVENVKSKPIAASAAIADFILASIGGKGTPCSDQHPC